MGQAGFMIVTPSRVRRSALPIVILAVAFGLRVWNLAGQSFWWDEAYSTIVARGSLASIIATLAREDYHPPLHYVILHYWLRLAGPSEFALRFVSVWAGVATVAVAWVAAKRILGKSAGPYAAAIFALAPFLWYYQREARMFALVPLFALLALYFLVRAADTGARWAWAAYACCVALGLWDLYYAIFLPFAAGLWVVLRGVYPSSLPPLRAGEGAGGRGKSGHNQRPPRPVIAWAISTALAFVAYLPWVPIFLHRASVWSSTSPPDNTPLKIITWSWPAFVLGLPTLGLYQQPLPAILLGAAAVITVAGMALAVGSLLPLDSLLAGVAGSERGRPRPSRLGATARGVSRLLVRDGRGRPRSEPAMPVPRSASGSIAANRRGLLLAVLALVVPWGAMAAIAAVKPIFHPRYAIPAAPGLDLLWAGILAGLWQAKRSRAQAVGGVVVSCVLLGCAAYGLDRLNTDPAYFRDDYRGAIGYVRSHEQPGDVIIHNAVPPFAYYDAGPAPASYFPTGPDDEANVVSELNRLANGHQRLWYVMHTAIPNDPNGFADTQLRLHAKLIDERWFGFLRVQLWQLPGPNPFSVASFVPATVDFAGQVEVTGYAISGEAVGGKALDVELRLRASRTPDADDGFWVALEDAQGDLWGRADVRPQDGSYRPSGSWPAGEEVVVRSDLPVALGTPPGSYQVVVGAYRLRDLTGLNVLDAGGHPLGQQAVIGSLDVARPTFAATDPGLPDQREAVIQPGLVLAADHVESTSLAPGDQLKTTLLWHPGQPLPALQDKLVLKAANGTTIAEAGGPLGGAFSSDRWEAGALVREQRTLTVPATAPAGPAALVLSVGDGDPVTLGSVAITAVTRVYAQPNSEHPVDATFGSAISLVGYDLSKSKVRPGDELTLSAVWRANQVPATSYRVFVHLIDANDHIWAQWDGVPRNWTYPTSAWLPGEFVQDSYTLKLPAQLPATSLKLEVGLYDATSGQRLSVVTVPASAVADRVILQTLAVSPS
jgi:uncharacterized membrane protein